MSKKRDSEPKPESNKGNSAHPDQKRAADIQVSSTQEQTRRAVWREFPGPTDFEVQLRVAMRREAYADVTAHAHESLDAEVCGVLVGEVCEDERGTFVDVLASIRGTAARAGSLHVTFTQETWTLIHTTLERDYAGLQIVGWYHTHPGLGVEFSEMDVFIQKNFFPLPTHLALVFDPLGGDIALAINGSEGIQYLDRFWVSGREKRCVFRVAPGGGSSSTSGPDPRALEALEVRLSQLTRAFDDLRSSVYRTVFGAVFFTGLLVAGLVGYGFYTEWSRSLVPPRLTQAYVVPVRIGDQVLLLDVAVVGWDLPRGLTLRQDNNPGRGFELPPPSGSAPGGQPQGTQPQLASPAGSAPNQPEKKDTDKK